MRDVSATVINSLIHFMYNGAVDVPQDTLNEFLSTAQSLEVRGLAEDAPPAPGIRKVSRNTLYRVFF